MPHKAVQILSPNDARDRWVFRELVTIGDDEVLSPHYSELVFENPGTIVWTGEITRDGDLHAAPLSFVETSTGSESSWSVRITASGIAA